MKKSFLFLLGLALTAATLTSCKGRTLDNVEPTGDTIEVNPGPIAPADTVDTLQNF